MHCSQYYATIHKVTTKLMPMSQHSELESIIEDAIELARTKSHNYVTTEHLLLALIRHQPFRKTLDKFGTDAGMLDQEVDGYLNSLTSIVSKSADVQPKKTSALECIFNRANVQVMFTGRRTLTVIDVYLSIMAETNSHAHYFLLKYGVKKQEFVDHWTKTYSHSDAKLSQAQATEILTEYCTDLTGAARGNRLEPMIGRATEVQEMVTTLARRFKANVLMVGDPGVGKTHIVEGLAQEIVAGRVPEFLKDHEVWSLEIGSLLA